MATSSGRIGKPCPLSVRPLSPDIVSPARPPPGEVRTLTRTTLCLCLVLCALTAGRAQPQETAPPKEAPATFPTQLEQVTVDVVVTDGKGSPIPDLTQEALKQLLIKPRLT